MPYLLTFSRLARRVCATCPARAHALMLAACLLLLWNGMLPARAQSSNALDSIDFGNPLSEASHNFNPGATVLPNPGIGAYGQTYRSLWGSGGTLTSGNQQLTFTVKCDPALQNYLTIKLWGNDNPQCYIYIQGQDNADSTGTPLDETNGALPFPNRFYYVTQPLPLGMTRGLTSVQVTLTASAPTGQPDRNVYSAFSHTATRFEPDPQDATGVKPGQSGYLAPTSAFTATQIYAQLLADRQAVFGTSGAYNQVLSRQVPPGTTGAPPEAIGLCVSSAAQLQSDITNHATAEQWRNDVYNGMGGLGYSHLPEPLWWLLGESYLLPPYTDQNGSTVSGLDHYHDATILQRYIWALDGSTYQQDIDGGFGQNYGEWMGLCSTPRDSTSIWPGTTDRKEWSISFEGAGIYAMAYNFVRLLRDPTAGPLLQQYLGQSYDADFSGTPMLRAYAYERMFHNFSMFAFGQMNGQTVPSASTVSQINYQQSGAYACQVANEYLQALYPNANYVFAESEEMNELNGALGLIPSGPGGTNTNYPNYEIDSFGLGEAEGTQSGGYDGRYGEILPQMAERWAMMAPLDPGITDPNEISAIQRVARNTVDAFSHFESPGENAYWDYTTGLFHDDYHFSQEDFITYRDPYNINSDGGWWTFEDYVYDADPASPVLSPVALRSLYLANLYGQFSPPGNAQQIDYTESALKSLIGLDPSTIPAMQGEPGQPNSAWADVQLGDVAAYYNGERLYINSDYRGSATPNYLARYHDTVGAVDRAGFVFMPHDATTVQSDGYVSGDFAHPWFDRIGPWLCAFNRTSAPISVTLPSGAGSAVELISGVRYSMGASVPLAANTAAVFALPGAGSTSNGTAPLLADGLYTLANIGSGLPAEDRANGLGSGAVVDQAAATGGAGQKWQLTNVGNNVVRLSNAYSLLSLDTASASPGAAVVLNPYNYAAAQNGQLWAIAPSAAGDTLTNVASGLVLDVPGGSTAGGTALDQAAATGAASQQWLLTPTTLLPDGAYSVVGAATGLVWDANGPGSDYARTITNVPTGGTSQRWNLVNYPNGNISLSDQADGKTTQIIFGTPTPGGQVAVYPAPAWWHVTNYGQGRVGLAYATGLGLPLEDDSTPTSPGTIITQQAPSGALNQQWTFTTAIATPQNVTTVEGQPVGVALSGADLNTPAQPLTYAVTSPPQHGALTGTAPNLTYTPAAGFIGTDSFQFTAGDSGPSAPATVSLSVLPTGTFSAADGSFETPSVGAGAYQYRPTGGPWTFTGNSGIQSNGSGWGAPAAPDGTQTAFLQGNGSSGAVSQAATFSQAGSYQVSFQAAQRSGQTQPVQVSVDGVAVGGPLTPVGNGFQPYKTASFTLSTAGSHTLSFTATDGTGDKTTFIDLVTLVPTVSVATAASATPNPVTGTTTSVSVLGAESGGDLGLTYTWSATGPAPVAFSPNGANAAKNATATFGKAGSYTLTATLSDGVGGATTSSVAVNVNATPTAILLSPTAADLTPGGTQAFTAVASDQFGSALAAQPAVTWSATGDGTITSAGVFTAGASLGTAAVTATSGSLTGTATITVSIKINSGGPAVAPFAADTDFSGGSSGGNSNAVSTTGVTNPAPMAVYQTERYGNFSYVIPNLAPNAPCTVRLHFAEIYWNAAGQRIENVSINGSPVLSNFDVFVVAGGARQALVEQFAATADSGGRITVAVSPVSGSPDQHAEIKGLEILARSPTPPTVATPASASSSPITGTTANLSVLGADAGGENTLAYTWSATGPATVAFSPNGANAAKNAVATFTQAGAYTLTAAITDGTGQAVTSSVAVTVNQTPTTVTVSPATASVPAGRTQQFTAAAADQFDAPLAPQPAFTWAATGAGSVSTTGLFTAAATSGSAAVTAADGSLVSAPAAVTVTAPTPAKLAALTLNPTSIVGGQANATGTVTLMQAAATDTVVALASSNAAALTVPASVTIPAGATTATFTATSHAVSAAAASKVTATLGTVYKVVNVYVNPAPVTLSTMTLSPTSLIGGTANATGTVTLSQAAATNTAVTLASSNTAALTVPASVTVVAGATTATFTATSHTVSAVASAKVTAKLGVGNKTINVYVNPAPPAALYSLTLSPLSVKGGSANSTGTVTLKAAAASATTITLTSGSVSALSVPASVTVAAGATSATFTATSHAVTTATVAKVTATLGSGYKAVNVTVTR